TLQLADQAVHQGAQCLVGARARKRDQDRSGRTLAGYEAPGLTDSTGDRPAPVDPPACAEVLSGSDGAGPQASCLAVIEFAQDRLGDIPHAASRRLLAGRSPATTFRPDD